MLFSAVKEYFIAPKKQKVIDKKVLVDGNFFHLISAYEDDDKVKIITLYVAESEDDVNINMFRAKTKREEFLYQENLKSDKHIDTQDLYFDDEKLQISFSSSDAMGCNFLDSFMLTYIIGLGLDLDYLENIKIENISVSTYVIENHTLDTLDFDKAKTFRFTRFPNYKTILLNIDFNLTSNKELYSFKDKDNNVFEFYARLIEVDIWNEVVPEMEKLQSEAYESLSEKEKQIQKMTDVASAYEELCPRGMSLLCVAYEGEDQLKFYTKEFLDSEIERKNQGTAFLCMSNKETNERTCIIGAYEKGTVKNLELELFSRVKNIVQNDIIIDL